MKVDKWAVAGFLIVFLFVLSLVALGWTASSIPLPGDLSNSPSYGIVMAYVIGLLFNGTAFIGCILYLSKKYMTKVDQIAENTPTLIQALESIKKAMDAHTKSITDHYQTLELQGKQIVKINTIHEIRGCDKSIGFENK